MSVTSGRAIGDDVGDPSSIEDGSNTSLGTFVGMLVNWGMSAPSGRVAGDGTNVGDGKPVIGFKGGIVAGLVVGSISGIEVGLLGVLLSIGERVEGIS